MAIVPCLWPNVRSEIEMPSTGAFQYWRQHLLALPSTGCNALGQNLLPSLGLSCRMSKRANIGTCCQSVLGALRINTCKGNWIPLTSAWKEKVLVKYSYFGYWLSSIYSSPTAWPTALLSSDKCNRPSCLVSPHSCGPLFFHFLEMPVPAVVPISCLPLDSHYLFPIGFLRLDASHLLLNQI